MNQGQHDPELTIREWKKGCIDFFMVGGPKTAEDWDELASIMLKADEDGVLSPDLSERIMRHITGE